MQDRVEVTISQQEALPAGAGPSPGEPPATARKQDISNITAPDGGQGGIAAQGGEVVGLLALTVLARRPVST
jgi:hypothetical protein